MHIAICFSLGAVINMTQAQLNTKLGILLLEGLADKYEYEYSLGLQLKPNN